MGQEKKIRRIELTKKVRVLCNFCESSRSRYEVRQHEQGQEAGSSLETDLKRLRLLTRRMTGTDLEGLSFTELLLLESQLKDVLPIVRNQQMKVKLQEDERLRKQKKGPEDKDGLGRDLSVPCKSSGSSSEDRPHKRDDEAPVTRLQREFERRNAESMQCEFDRLWLLNERMNGRDLDGLTFFELLVLEGQILTGILRVKDHMGRPALEQMARQRKEESTTMLAEQEKCASLDNDNGKNDRHRDISLRFGSQHTLLSASRKLRRFQNRTCQRRDGSARLKCFRLTNRELIAKTFLGSF